MEFIPYSRQEILDSDLAAVHNVLKSDFLTQGPEIEKFERSFASLHEQQYAVAVCNATAALHISCMALGVGPEDIVWTSPNSFVASANCARYCGAAVDFVDIDPVTRNMSVEKLSSKLKEGAEKNRLPKVLIPVDFGGLPCDMKEIRSLADRYGFKIISDSSHAVGAEYDNKPIGAYADISVFSFHPVKIVTTGEGGLCLTDDMALAESLKLLRSHGITRQPDLMDQNPEGKWYYQQISLGMNYRLTDIQAALGSSQLERLASNHEKRDRLAKRYDEILSTLPLKLPVRLADRQSAHHLYAIEIDRFKVDKSRKQVFEHLVGSNIGVNVHYIPVHLHPYYREQGFCAGDFPASEAYYNQAITLPLFPSMSKGQQDYVAAALFKILSS